MPNLTSSPTRKSKAEVAQNLRALLLDDEPQKNGTAVNAAETLDIDDLVPYTNHPFRLYEGKRLDDMAQTIKEHGVIVPVIARPHPSDEYEGKFEILSGHNRVNAAKIAGLTEVPVVVRTDLTDLQARNIVIITNLIQRSFADMSHSERALVLKTYLDNIEAQGKRNDLLDEIKKLSNPHEIEENGTCGLINHKSKSRDKAAEQYGLDARTVSRYKRISLLSRELLNRVDADEIGLYPAESLSYLSSDEQDELDRLLNETAYKVDMKKAKSLRELSEGKKLTDEKMMQILSGELYKKPKTKTAPPLKIKAKIYQKFFDDKCSQSEMEVIIEKADRKSVV